MLAIQYIDGIFVNPLFLLAITNLFIKMDYRGAGGK
jgi:hypothetical protein